MQPFGVQIKNTHKKMVEKRFSGSCAKVSSYRLPNALFWLVCAYVFILPFRSVELPGVFFGFSINPSRIIAIFFLFGIFSFLCFNPHIFNRIISFHSCEAKLLNTLLLLFYLSTLAYYFNLFNGNTVKFGVEDFFFRSWKGRPVGQLIAFVTYAVIPYYLIRYYAKNNDHRKLIEKTMVYSILVLTYYGFFQMICYYLNLPVTGRDLYEGVIPAESIQGFGGMLRSYSLGGEPRHYGAFIIGGLFFYLYYTHSRLNGRVLLNIILMLISFLLTLSTIAYIAFTIAITIICIDCVLTNRPKILFKILFIGFGFFSIIYLSDCYNLFLSKTIRYYYSYIASLSNNIDLSGSMINSQDSSVSFIDYLIKFPSINFHNQLFGFGYGNFSEGVHEIIKSRYGHDLVADPNICDSSFYLYQLLVECGLVGVGLFGALILYHLNICNKLILKQSRGKIPITKQQIIMLRFTLIAFTISALVTLSFQFVILMALISGIRARTEIHKRPEGCRQLIDHTGKPTF